VQIGLTLVLVLFIPRIPHHDPLGAHSLAQFVSAFATAAAWPLVPALAVVLHAPMIALTASIAKRRPAVQDGRWKFFGLWLWLGLQFASLAYGRAVDATASRYLDVFIVGLVLNFGALLYLLGDAPRFLVSLLASLWLLIVSVDAYHKASLKAAPGVVARRVFTDTATQKVQEYIDTGNAAVLSDGAPFPVADYLQELLSDPQIRRILQPDGGRPIVVRLRRSALGHSQFIIALGVAVFFFGLIYCAPSRLVAANPKT
jgi:hypothetical protein